MSSRSDSSSTSEDARPRRCAALDALLLSTRIRAAARRSVLSLRDVEPVLAALRAAALPLDGLSRRRARPVTRAAAFALALAVAGCTLLGKSTDAAPDAASAGTVVAAATAAAPAAKPAPAKDEAPARIAFNHQFHLGRGPACLDCHEGADQKDKADMPKVTFCMDCHEEIDAKKPKEKTIAAFLDKPGGTPVWSHVTRQSDDIVFSHKTHAAKKVDCAECHKAIADSTEVTKSLFADMDACTKCHESRGAKTECATCHRAAAQSVAAGTGPFFRPANHQDPTWRARHGRTWREPAAAVRAEKCDACHGKPDFPEPSNCNTCHAETKPADHLRMWKTFHGQAVRNDPSVRSGRCAVCHAESTCRTCHSTEPPRDHSQSWRVNGGHGLAAALDRTRCEACHTSDTCIACHTTLAPRSHRGGWGAPRDAHCLSCHLPLEQDTPGGCGVCHASTPAHDAAPRLPSSPVVHTPSLQCRQCHYGPPSLKHADNGTNCVQCHR